MLVGIDVNLLAIWDLRGHHQPYPSRLEGLECDGPSDIGEHSHMGYAATKRAYPGLLFGTHGSLHGHGQSVRSDILHLLVALVFVERTT